MTKYYEDEPAAKPIFLSLYIRGPSYDVQIDKQGVYKMTDDIKNGKPTWKNNETGYWIFFHCKIEI